MENLIFKDLNLSKELEKAIVEMGFEEATPIQSQSIPHILNGNDVIGQAQTGTGKTCAFGIPAIEMLDSSSDFIQVLILCPTRELVIQTSEELKNVSKYKRNVKILPIFGGQPIDRQIKALKKRPQIIIGTPGRIMDHMRRNTLKFSNLSMVILDEADEMLNMGFREDIDTILEKVPLEKQTIFFSATMPKEILDLTKKYQKNPVHIRVKHKELTVPSIEQFYLEVSNSSKLEVLSRLIDTNNIKLSIIFCNTKKCVDELTSSLQSRGYSAESLHGDMKQEQRDKVMSQFKKGRFEILIATDVAARGIDVNCVEAVFNYDIPNDEEYYVHRIGRTGRAGKSGKAFTFVSGREIFKLRYIQKYTKSIVKPIKPPTLNDVEETRLSFILDTVKETLEDNHYSKYLNYVEKTIEDINSKNGGDEDNFASNIDIAAVLLKMIAEQNGNQANSLPNIDYHDQSSSGDSGKIVKFFINTGKNHKIKKEHIIDLIVSSTSVPLSLIKSVDIFDNYSFASVPQNYADEVLSALKNQKLKGKRINIEISHSQKKPKRKNKAVC